MFGNVSERHLYLNPLIIIESGPLISSSEGSKVNSKTNEIRIRKCLFS